MKRLVLLGSALALGAAAGLSVHLVTAGSAPARSGRVTLAHSRGAPRGPVLREGALLGVRKTPLRLDVEASAPLVGNLGPVAALSRDGRSLAYNSWRWVKAIDWRESLGGQGIQTGDTLGSPTLRVKNVATGVESPLEPGTFSVAWGPDGALAYVRGVEPTYRANTPYLRTVVVRNAATASPTVWLARPDRYTVLGWARRELVVRRDIPGGNADLLTLDGPGSMRPLASDVDLLAISPDGSDVLVAESIASTTSPAVRLLRVSDGSELARLPVAAIVDPAAAAPLTWVNGPGDWRGDRVVLTSSTGLVVLHVKGGTLAVEQVLHVDSATRPNGSFYEPRFTDDGGHTIVTWADLPASGGRQSAQFVCDRYALTCREGVAVASADAPRPVYDESGGDQ